MGQEYFLGLDMGTGSVGWAVTNENYEVLRKHGKSLWGVRLFESANTAEERRLFRTSRRRLDRRNRRIQVLQELFAEEISKVDPGFYLRLKESRYLPDDKRDSDGNCPELPYALFVDKNYTDKNYHKQFPTIYHLRKYLMETMDTPDIRLVYLAFHHMMKHRGHFLLSGDVNNIKEFRPTFLQLIDNIKNEEIEEFKISISDEDCDFVENILKNGKLQKSVKKTELIKYFNAKSACEKAVLTLISGGTVKLSDIFGNDELDNCERPKISFSDSMYDDYCSVVEDALAEEYLIIESAKAVYDWAVLADVLKDSASISEAKVKTYEKHKKDLAYLKKVVKENLGSDVYKQVFVVSDDKVKNYPAYVGMTKVNGKKIQIQGKQATKEDFYDFLQKNVIAKLNDPIAAQKITEEIEVGTFLPKQVNKDNGVIPHQIHLYELKQILENLENRIPMLKANKEKFIQLFTFRIPYYVGPLNVVKDENDKKFTWAKRKSNDNIYPWNFEEVIDVEESAERFILRMTNKCTYLPTEDVLPKDSLLYSKFTVLNELNNLRLDGEKISVELKQRIYNEIFKTKRKVTQKHLRAVLKSWGIATDKTEITGIDVDFKGSLTSYHDFKQKLTGVELSNREKEQIILNIVLFGDDKKLLRNRLKKMFPQFTENQLKAVCSLSYKGWGRLSKKFLEEVISPAPETAEAWNIITAMWETNDNLMQLLSSDYLFMSEVERLTSGNSITEITYETVDDLYVSPSVKRQIWQTVKIVEELEKVMGKAPKRVFVEMAREKQESKRTESRKNQLVALYKKIKEESVLLEKLSETEENKLRSDRLYLYYTQMGRCMYSGETISLDDLWNDNLYDIDHIYPQSKTMDDSLDNRVLVKKEYNAKKSDNYPIFDSWRSNMRDFWKMLYDRNLISKEKLHRLMRNEGFSDNELAGFINRQLVETRQSTKAVADILKRTLPDTEIVYSKAGNVSKFRQDFDLIKVRDLNDLHHAKDAYLNIVVGNTYFVKFTKNAGWFVKENPGRTYNIKKMFKQYDIVRNGETAWVVGDDGSISTVKKYYCRNDILVTRRAYEVRGGLFDQQLMKKGNGQVPIKSSDERLHNIDKYGGYNKATGTYFMLVESIDKKGKTIRTIEYVPLYLRAEFEDKDSTKAVKELEKRGLKNPRILLNKIKIDSLFDVDGFKMWLSGRTENRLIFKNANQLLLNSEETTILKKVVKYVNRYGENKNLKLSVWDELETADLVELYDVFLSKIRDTVYNIRLSAQVKTLTDKREKFICLPDEEKCIVLNEILHMFQCTAVSANLKLIEGPASAGILVLNNNITSLKEMSIINQSITGIYEQRIDLLHDI